MTRMTLGALAVALAMAAPSPAASPPSAVPLELAVLDGDRLARVELRAATGGGPVASVWDATFARIAAYFDRDGDGVLIEKECAALPSPRSLRQAMGNGFTPPTGPAPAFAVLDRDRDGKVTLAELTAFYRSAGAGNVVVGVGRLPTSAELATALRRHLDGDGDGRIDEKEWQSAADSLRKLDKNDDELIGVGELVPKTLYPGAAGTLLLTPPAEGEQTPETLARLPLVLLPADGRDVRWATEVARRNPRLKADDLFAVRGREPDARWEVNLGGSEGAGQFTFAGRSVRIDGWVAAGGTDESVASARKALIAQLEAPSEDRRDATSLAWLVATADRDGDGKLDRKELDAWLDLQGQVARGQVLLTVLDGAGLFELLDRNHDGGLSVRELRGAWSRLKETGCVSGGAFDADRLPRSVLAVVSHGYPRSLATDARRGPAWFRAMDRNGDGDVSSREFTGPAEVFRKLDLDKDGLLDADEAGRAAPVP